MLRGITNDIVISVICYIMLKGITGAIATLSNMSVPGKYSFTETHREQLSWISTFLCNKKWRKNQANKRNYWSLWLRLLYVM
jgi:hypothetical protein